MKSKRKPSQQFSKKFFVKLLFEILSVVLAVSLALIANEWRKNQSNKRLVLNAWSNIKKEISLNREQLENIFPYHDSIIHLIDSTITKIENREKEVYVRFESVQLIILSSTAWETTKVTDVINYMKFEHIMKISEVYNNQRIYSDFVDNFILGQQIFGKITFDEQIKLLYSTKQYLEHFIGIGNQLIENYKEAIDILQKNYSGI